VFSAFAGLTKFAPFVLAPLMLRGTGEFPRARRLAWFVIAFVVAIVAAMAPVVLNHDWHYFWQDTVVYQFNRPAPFSIWGLWGGAQANVASSLQPEQRIVEVATVLFGLAVMIWPRGKRDLVQVAALAAALVICLQLCLEYWFYLYIPWFFAPLIVALAGSMPEPAHPQPPALTTPSAAPAPA
jgi:hypothetical protein